MAAGAPYRPRVSRETRLLFTAGLLALAALWILARIRYPDRPVTPNPVPAVLGQFATGPKHEDLAREVSESQLRVQPLLLTLDLRGPAGQEAPERAVALRLRGDLAVTVMPSGTPRSDSVLVGIDGASGLAVVKAPWVSALPPLVVWTPRPAQPSGFVLATSHSLQGVSLRPVFVGALDPVETALWPAPVYAVPAHTDLTPGSFLFSIGAELIGLVVDDGGRLVIVPGEILLVEAERLLASPPAASGTLGVEVQALTPAVASLTGASRGVVVTWVEPSSPAEGQLVVGDVVEMVDDRLLTTDRAWAVRMARLSAGESVRLRVRRGGDVQEASVTASAVVPSPPPQSRELGLGMRARPRVGAEIVRVERGSAGDRAGMAPGDIITHVDDIATPTPAQVARIFGALAAGERAMLGVTRGDSHLVTTLGR